MPLPETEKTITLEAVGAPEFEVTFKRLPGMLYEESQKYHRVAVQIKDSGHKAEHMFKSLVISWNLEDKDGTTHSLPSDDPKVIWRVPTHFVDHIASEMAKDAVGEEESGLA